MFLLISRLKKGRFLEWKSAFVEPDYFFFIRYWLTVLSLLLLFLVGLYSFHSILELSICLFSLINWGETVTSPEALFSWNMCVDVGNTPGLSVTVIFHHICGISEHVFKVEKLCFPRLQFYLFIVSREKFCQLKYSDFTNIYYSADCIYAPYTFHTLIIYVYIQCAWFISAHIILYINTHVHARNRYRVCILSNVLTLSCKSLEAQLIFIYPKN